MCVAPDRQLFRPNSAHLSEGFTVHRIQCAPIQDFFHSETSKRSSSGVGFDERQVKGINSRRSALKSLSIRRAAPGYRRRAH
jgi:hypothetical protein